MPKSALSRDEIDFSKKLLSPEDIESIHTHLALDAEEMRKAGTTGFLIRGLVNASLPYKDPKTPIFERVNGDTTLRMLSGSSFGLPFGRYPRFLLAWLTTEIVRTKNAELYLGDTLRQFLVDVVGVKDTGGQRGSRTRLLEQTARLFGSTITVDHMPMRGADGSQQLRGLKIRNISVGDGLEFADDIDKRLWTPQSEADAGRFQSRLIVSNRFFQECIDAPVPLNLNAYRDLSKSPLAMDIYAWLTYRMSYLKGSTRPIPWAALMLQFGAAYNSEGGERYFKRDFLTALTAVQDVYPEARITIEQNGLKLLPSPTHIAMTRKLQQGKLTF